MDAAWKALADYGVAIVALVAIAFFCWWLIRRYLTFLEAQLAASQKLNDSGSRVIESLTGHGNLIRLLTERVEENTDAVERLERKP